MPVFQTFMSLLGCIPTNVWQALKKLISSDKVVVSDTAFKVSTKYTPALLVIMLCLSVANQFVRNIEMDCATASEMSSGGSGRTNTPNTELNNYCWNMDTFLVAKALEPRFRGKVTYPGIHGYNKGKDAIIKQGYYKFVWLIVATLTIISYAPFFIWKVIGVRKMTPIIEAYDTDQTVAHFISTIGLNNSFSLQYFLCKLMATLTPFASWIFLIGFIGQRYRYYGTDVIAYFLNLGEENSWPHPMDALFPKIAKCEWTKFGYSGDRELLSVQCQLPMNNISQWSFFFFWWWMTLVFFINTFSVLITLIMSIPCYRSYRYRKLVLLVCQPDVELATGGPGMPPAPYSIQGPHGDQYTTNVEEKKIKLKPTDLVSVNLGFGDWLVLNFIKLNLEDWEFSDFIRKLATTRNPVLQLNPNPQPKKKKKKFKKLSKSPNYNNMLAGLPNQNFALDIMGTAPAKSVEDGESGCGADEDEYDLKGSSDTNCYLDSQTVPSSPAMQQQPMNGGVSMGFVTPLPRKQLPGNGAPPPIGFVYDDETVQSPSPNSKLKISTPVPIQRQSATKLNNSASSHSQPKKSTGSSGGARDPFRREH